MTLPKQAETEEQKELIDLMLTNKEEITLSSGKKLHVGWIMSDAQDKIDEIIVDFELAKKKIDEKDEMSMLKGRRLTRRFYAKSVAAILLNSHFSIKLFWGVKWRLIYHFWHLNGEDYQKIILAAKKNLTEQQYYLGMVLLMTMNDMWTTLTKKEAEVFRQELELASKQQS